MTLEFDTVFARERLGSNKPNSQSIINDVAIGIQKPPVIGKTCLHGLAAADMQRDVGGP